MKIAEHIHTGLQGFGFGAIVMAYIANYNRDQLLMALIFLIFSILLRLGCE